MNWSWVRRLSTSSRSCVYKWQKNIGNDSRDFYSFNACGLRFTKYMRVIIGANVSIARINMRPWRSFKWKLKKLTYCYPSLPEHANVSCMLGLISFDFIQAKNRLLTHSISTKIQQTRITKQKSKEFYQKLWSRCLKTSVSNTDNNSEKARHDISGAVSFQNKCLWCHNTKHTQNKSLENSDSLWISIFLFFKMW